MTISDTKIALLLRSLSEEEMSRLEEFIRSPFFNSSKQMMQLFDILKADYPAFEKVTKEDIYTKFYGKEDYKDKKIRDIFSRFLELCHEFLTQLELEKQYHTKKSLTLEQLLKRELDSSFRSVLKESRNKLYSSGIMDEEFFYREYTYSRVENDYYFALEKNPKKKLFTDYDEKDIQYFVNYIILRSLLYRSTNFSNVNTTELPEIELLDKLISYLDEHPKNDYPIIMILHNLAKLATEADGRKTYDRIISQLEEHIGSLELSMKRTIFVELYNFSKTQSVKGDPFFREEHYRLLKYSVENDLHPREGNYFIETSYINVASIALMKKDLEWAEYFIEKFKKEVRPDRRENAYILCMGMLNFRKKNYDEALKHLMKVSIDDEVYMHRVSNLRLRVHYERGDYETCTSLIDSYQHFIKKNKFMMEYMKERLTNYLNVMKRLVNVQLNGNKKHLFDIRKDVVSFIPEKIENRTWLLEQIDNIK
jgi:hypothetical protein